MNQRMTSTRKRTRIKAVGLLSGALDSTIAAKLMLEQDIEVYAINFTSPFCTCTPKKAGCASVVTAVKEPGGIPPIRVALGNEYPEIVRNPKHGYGSEMNPCIDCRIIKVRKAGEYMQELGAFFLFTGEVLGQRPMSQHRAALKLLYRESGLEGSIVRPLSARLLPPTIPEKEGRLERERLLGFRSRSRRPHIISTMPMQEDNGEGFTIEMLTHLSHSREERKVPVRQKWQWEKKRAVRTDDALTAYEFTGSIARTGSGRESYHHD